MKKILFPVLCIAAIFSLASCNTDIESVDINEPSIEHQNNEKYTNYLENLRDFKARNHKVTFGWFDNSIKTPTSQGQNILSVPDSLDYLVLKEPQYLNTRELKEIDKIRNDKAIKVLYEISFEALKAQYDVEVKAFRDNPENQGQSFPSLNTYVVDSVGSRLAYCDRYNLDGVVMTFEGKSKIYLSEAEKEELLGYENDFLGITKDWKDRHSDKILVLAGKPQNVTDKTLLEKASYLIIPCLDVVTESGISYNVSKAVVEGVPTNKFIPWVSTTSLKEGDLKTGYWTNARLAILGAAKWVSAEHESFTSAGLAIDNINNDYYHANFTYPVVRNAISIINPTIHN